MKIIQDNFNSNTKSEVEILNWGWNKLQSISLTKNQREIINKVKSYFIFKNYINKDKWYTCQNIIFKINQCQLKFYCDLKNLNHQELNSLFFLKYIKPKLDVFEKYLPTIKVLSNDEILQKILKNIEVEDLKDFKSNGTIANKSQKYINQQLELLEEYAHSNPDYLFLNQLQAQYANNVNMSWDEILDSQIQVAQFDFKKILDVFFDIELKWYKKIYYTVGYFFANLSLKKANYESKIIGLKKQSNINHMNLEIFLKQYSNKFKQNINDELFKEVKCSANSLPTETQLKSNSNSLFVSL